MPWSITIVCQHLVKWSATSRIIELLFVAFLSRPTRSPELKCHGLQWGVETEGFVFYQCLSIWQIPHFFMYSLVSTAFPIKYHSNHTGHKVQFPEHLSSPVGEQAAIMHNCRTPSPQIVMYTWSAHGLLELVTMFSELFCWDPYAIFKVLIIFSHLIYLPPCG